jgi:two-component sensor histidine kinase
MTPELENPEAGNTMAGGSVRHADVEANHRVANSLTLIASLVRLRAVRCGKAPDSFSAQHVELLLREISAQIDGIGLMHQVLCRAAQAGQVELTGYLADLCRALDATFSFAGMVRFEAQRSTACLVPAEQAKALGMLVNELVTNAIKYAHPTGVRGTVNVGYAVEADGTLRLDVADDGVGLPEDFDPASDVGLGFRLLRGVRDQLGARLEFHTSGIGLRVTLTVPAGARAAA